MQDRPVDNAPYLTHTHAGLTVEGWVRWLAVQWDLLRRLRGAESTFPIQPVDAAGQRTGQTLVGVLLHRPYVAVPDHVGRRASGVVTRGGADVCCRRERPQPVARP